MSTLSLWVNILLPPLRRVKVLHVFLSVLAPEVLCVSVLPGRQLADKAALVLRGGVSVEVPWCGWSLFGVPLEAVFSLHLYFSFRNPRVTKKFKVLRLCECTGAPSEFLTERTSRSSTSPKFFSPLPFLRRGSSRRCPCGRPCGQCRRLRPLTRSFCRVLRWR